MPSHKKIIGIDPGSRVAGYAVVEGTKELPVLPRDFRVIDAGAIKLDCTLPHGERIGQLHQVVSELVQTHKPDVGVLESAFAGKNINSALKLGEARGAIISSFFMNDLNFVQVAPTEIKKTIAGNGRAAKEQIALALESLMGFKLGNLPFDVSDALAMALTHGLCLAFNDKTSTTIAPARFDEIGK